VGILWSKLQVYISATKGSILRTRKCVSSVSMEIYKCNQREYTENQKMCQFSKHGDNSIIKTKALNHVEQYSLPKNSHQHHANKKICYSKNKLADKCKSYDVNSPIKRTSFQCCISQNLLPINRYQELNLIEIITLYFSNLN
jgi:hypothetical protein